jgi:hypothetical protein
MTDCLRCEAAWASRRKERGAVGLAIAEMAARANRGFRWAIATSGRCCAWQCGTDRDALLHLKCDQREWTWAVQRARMLDV